MAGLETSGNRGTRITTGIHDVLAVVVLSLVEQCLDARLGEGPCTGVKRLFLTPDDGLGIGVLVEVLLKLGPWEGVQLFNTSNGCVLDVVVGAMLDKSCIDLTCAEDDALCLLRWGDRDAMLWVRDDPLELRLASEILNGGTGKWVTEERLREEDDEG